MSLDQLVNVLANVTLIEMMVAIGLRVELSDIGPVVRDWTCLIRAAIANYVIVPAAAVALLLVFRSRSDDAASFAFVAAGLLIPAVCPGAPYGPPFTTMARGSVAVAVGLMVVLAGSSAIAAPLLLRLLLPIVAGGADVNINAAGLVFVLVAVQFVPLIVGLAIRKWLPVLADRLAGPAGKLSTILNLALLGLIIFAQFSMLVSIPLKAFVGMFALVGMSALAGWLLGARERVAMMMATSVRNVGVSLVIAAGSFPGTPAISSATAFAIFQTLVVAALAMAIGRRSVPDERGKPPNASPKVR